MDGECLLTGSPREGSRLARHRRKENREHEISPITRGGHGGYEERGERADAPVSIARILPLSESASCRIRNSWSSRVKMSFVTTAETPECALVRGQAREGRGRRARDGPILCESRKCRQRARVRAVLPEPTGLYANFEGK